ncbi:MAG TPA: nuclear transport factor 2 family protein [Candidatus Sulfotelmatobacter sp.]|jgi:hypothetical protein
MKTIHIAAACLLLLASLATAQEMQQAAARSAAAPATSALESNVRNVWEAFKNKNKAALGASLSNDFRQMEEGNSGMADKKAEVASVDEFELTSYMLKDFNVKSLGTHSALVTYTAHYEGKTGGQLAKSDSIFGEVWVHEGAGWKALYIQETAIKQP